MLLKESRGLSPSVDCSRRYTRILPILFLCTLPLVNPIVHGDGVGYYAYVRAPLIQHNLRFEEDWRHANLNFSQSRTMPSGQLLPSQYTETGYISNQFTVGPALLWAPFLVAAHGFVLLSDARGAHIPADGFSFPYLLAMALGTAFYGFLGLLLSYSLARKYVAAHWAFLATVGIWGASSLPVYMYFNPAWSHAQSAFAVALFLWYWDRTWGWRTLFEWTLLGFVAGLMVDVYFPNGVLLTLPLIEALSDYWNLVRAKDFHGARSLFAANCMFLAATGLAFVPTLITRAIVFGGFFRFGSYTEALWDWTAPNWRLVLLSSEHGLLSWTPILVLSFAGLSLPRRSARRVTAYLSVGAAAFYYVISSYPYWHGMASFGNRFFISLTSILVFGLALFLQRFAGLFRSVRWAFVSAAALLLLFVLWNVGLIFQWGAHLIPPRGPVSFSEVAHNQVFIVPRQLSADLRRYFFKRKDLMQQIEQRDIRQLEKNPPPP
ncbi:MAG: hypothetical protein DMF15_12840 [Verrucomicrobia bacterium]|nr:MAG: hypothetical protein DMF15_12840 [Verrucomicrobiota bacterium]